MMRIILALLLALLAVPAGDAQWANFQASTTASSGGGGTVGGGPNLRQANVFGVANSVDPSVWYQPGIAAQALTTTDWYFEDGYLSVHPYILPDGRYFWPVTADHPFVSGIQDWGDGADFRFGFSTDPQILPQSVNQSAAVPCRIPGNNSVANPISSNPFCLYQSGGNIVIEPNDTNGIYHWYAEGTDADASGTGVVMTGSVTNGSAVVTGITGSGAWTDTSLMVGGGATITYGGSAMVVTGTCLPGGTTYIQTVDSATQITLSQNANATRSCTLTFTHAQISHEEGAFRANNINGPWTLYGPVMPNYFDQDWSSFDNIIRSGSNSYIGFNDSASALRSGKRTDGNLTVAGDPFRSNEVWTDSSIGLAFTRPDPPQSPLSWSIPVGYPLAVGSRTFQAGSFDLVNIAGQNWMCAREDARPVGITSANPAVVTKYAHGLNANDPVYFENSGSLLTATVTAGSNLVTSLGSTGAGNISDLQVGQEIDWTGADPSETYTKQTPGTTIIAINQGGDPANSLRMSNVSLGNSLAGDWFKVWTLPQPIMRDVTYYVKTVLNADTFTISASPGGAAINTNGSQQAGGHNMPAGGNYVTRVALDASMNVVASPAPVRISSAYSGMFPGPTYLQIVNCMLENGVLTYYALRGFPTVQGGIVAGLPYNAGNHFPYNNGGSLWHEMVDIYSEIVDASAAANAAPFGVKVSSSAAGVITLTWNDALPTQTYRLYRGTSPTVQTTLVGDFTGLTATDTPYLQVPSVQYYKLVYLNGGTEKGSRVVHTYVSPYTAFTNAHMTRVLDDGVDPATVDLAKIDTIYNWLVSHNHFNSLEHGAGASAGVKQDTSGVVSKMYDIGTTRLPRGNDLWFCATVATVCTAMSTATYSPTKINNTTPAVTVPVGAFGVFGGLTDSVGRNGRLNNIRRKWAHTVIASYVKSSVSGDTTLFGTGEFSNMALQHTAGTPGSVSFILADDVGNQTATIPVPGSATSPHIIAGTFGCAPATGANPCPGVMTGTLKAYVDGTNSGGTNNTSLHGNSDLSLSTILIGSRGLLGPTLVNTGSLNSRFTYNADPTPGEYRLSNNSTAYDIDWIFNFEDEWSAADIASFTTLLQDFVSPPTAITSVAAGGISMGSPAVYDITAMPSGASATCNTGTPANDSPAFANFQTLASAWDAANPGATGSIVLNIPNSTCWFLGSGIAPFKWAMNPSGYAGQARVRVVGAGTSSKLSDGGTGGGFFPGGGGQFGNNTSQTRVTTVSKGATALNFTACPGAGCAAALALFAPGAPVLMTGVDLQGEGQPTNPAFWDFLTVATVTATGVTVTTPITHDYKSTWPNYSTGSGFQPDQGGPGTLYVLDPTWNVSIELNRLILDQGAGAGGSVTNGKSVTLKNVVITSAATSCQGPSVNGFLAWINVTATNCTVEVDKLIDTFVLQNVTAVTNVDWQSASAKQFIASEVTASSFLGAGGINNIVANSSPAELHLGSHGYGASYGRDYIIGNNIPILIVGGASQSMINLRGTWSGGVLTVPPNFTFSAAQNSSAAPCSAAPGNICLTVSSTTGWSTGMATDTIVLSGSASCQGDWILTVVDATHVILNGSTFAATCTGGSATLPLKWAVPGANLYWDGANTSQGPMAQVLDVGASGANTTVTTSLAGAFPTMPLNSGVATVKVQSVPQVFASGNYGSAAAIDLNQTPAGAPYGSYSKLIVAGTNGSYASVPAGASPTVTGNPSTPYTVPVWGQMVGINLTVGPAYSGSTGTMNFLFAQSYFTQTLGSGSVPGAWNPTVNAKIASTTPRFLGPTSTSGAQTLDVLSSPPGGANSWLLTNQTQPVYTTIPGDFSTTSTTVEIITNQGVVNPAQQ